MKASLYQLKPRNEVKENKVEGIMNNGLDNAYPTRMERIILASVTAKAAAEMYANFLVGDGFVNETLNKLVVGTYNYKDVTLFNILERVAHSIAYQGGYFLHLNIGFDGRKYFYTDINPVIYKNCRLGKVDDINYNAKVVYSNDWEKRQTKRLRQIFDTFNLNQTVIKSQIEKAGSIKSYNGQIFWDFFDNEYIYPLSPIDSAQDDADTEHQISLFKNGQVNKNFFASYILRHAYFASEVEKQKFIDQLQQFQGGDNAGSIMLIEDDITTDEKGEINDNGLKFEKIEANINDKIFENWETSIANNIRKSFKAIPQVLIEYVEGKLGNTSGESLIQAANFYNKMTEKDRIKISQAFQMIFTHYKTPINDTFEIKPFNFGNNNI